MLNVCFFYNSKKRKTKTATKRTKKGKMKHKIVNPKKVIEEEKPRTPSSPIARSAAVDVEDSKWRVVLNLVAVGLTFYLLQRVAKEFEKSGNWWTWIYFCI